jgi:hypothetical protein
VGDALVGAAVVGDALAGDAVVGTRTSPMSSYGCRQWRMLSYLDSGSFLLNEPSPSTARRSAAGLVAQADASTSRAFSSPSVAVSTAADADAGVAPAARTVAPRGSSGRQWPCLRSSSSSAARVAFHRRAPTVAA